MITSKENIVEIYDTSKIRDYYTSYSKTKISIPEALRILIAKLINKLFQNVIGENYLYRVCTICDIT